jgi:hypothetical protein
MDEHERNAIAASLRGHDRDPGLKKCADNIIKNPSMLRDDDDYLAFDKDACTTRCNGKCCTGIDLVRVSPVDIDHVMRSDAVAGLKRSAVVTACFDIALGAVSKLPLATIHFLTTRDGIKLCPFMAITAGTRSSIGGMIGSIKQTSARGICILGQTKKPAVCMLFPLGNFKHPDRDAWMYFQATGCPGTETTKKIKVRDVTRPYIARAEKNARYQSAMLAMIDVARKELKDDLAVDRFLGNVSFILFMEDGETMDKIDRINAVLPELLACSKLVA